MISSDFESTLKNKTQHINTMLHSFMPKEKELNGSIKEALEYSLMAGGKRLRPMLMHESYMMFGGKEEVIKPFMVAIEMIHTYSLVHDDLPAMDNDTYRRGEKTTWFKYTEAMGILAGDALLNSAFEISLQAFEMTSKTALVVEAMKILANKAGIYGMIGGQSVDVLNTDTQIDEAVLSYIYRLKTGALLEASMMIGAVLAGAGQKEVDCTREAAENIGMAFQIQDDILDVISSDKELGKPVGSDKKNHKVTFVTHYGMDKATAMVSEYSNRGINKLNETGKENKFMLELIESLIHRRK